MLTPIGASFKQTKKYWLDQTNLGERRGLIEEATESAEVPAGNATLSVGCRRSLEEAMPACDGHQTLNDLALSRLDRAQPQGSAVHEPGSKDLSTAPSGDRFRAAGSLSDRSERDHCGAGPGGGEHWDVAPGEEALASRDSVSTSSISGGAVTFPPSCFGKTKEVAAKFAQEEEIKGSWTCSLNHSFQDEPIPESALSRLIRRAPAMRLVGTLLLGIGIGGVGVGVVVSDRIGSLTPKLTDAISDPAQARLVSPAKRTPMAVGGPNAPIDGTAGAIEARTARTVGARASAGAAVVDRIRPIRTSSPPRPIAVVSALSEQPPPETATNGSIPHARPPMGDATPSRRADTSIGAGASMVEKKQLEGHEAGSIPQPHSTVTTTTPSPHLAALLKETEEETRQLAQRIAASSPLDHAYKIQLGLFLEKENADHYRNSLSNLAGIFNHDFNLEEITINETKYHRLYTGKFAILNDAIAACNAIKESGIDCYVVY